MKQLKNKNRGLFHDEKIGIVKPFCDFGNRRYNILFGIIARFDVSTLRGIWFDSRAI
jgi:hypothetical protein